jgi:hypothetical protein
MSSFRLQVDHVAVADVDSLIRPHKVVMVVLKALRIRYACRSAPVRMIRAVRPQLGCPDWEIVPCSGRSCHPGHDLPIYMTKDHSFAASGPYAALEVDLREWKTLSSDRKEEISCWLVCSGEVPPVVVRWLFVS